MMVVISDAPAIRMAVYVFDQLGAAVSGLAHGHVDGDRGQTETNDHDHRSYHNRWQQALNEAWAPQAYQQAEQDIDHAGGDQTAECGGQAPGLVAVHDRGDEGEAGGQEDWNLSAGGELEQQGADTGGKQGNAGVHAGNQRHQYQCAESHKQHLGTGQRSAPAVGLNAFHQTISFCLVPKILSPASPRPGMM